MIRMNTEEAAATRLWPANAAGPVRRPAPAVLKDTGLAERLHFLASFLRRPATVGSLTPSSLALGRAMVRGCSLREAKVVVELGAGTGALTRLLLRRIGRNTKLIALELDETSVHLLRRRFPRARIVHDSAENLLDHLPAPRERQADCIVSGLPWGSMPQPTRERIMTALLRGLRPGGTFLAFAYLHATWFPSARDFRRQLHRHFSDVVTSPVIWRNLPPAIVYRCR